MVAAGGGEENFDNQMLWWSSGLSVRQKHQRVHRSTHPSSFQSTTDVLSVSVGVGGVN